MYTLLLTWDLFFLSPTKGPNFFPFKIDFVAQTPEKIHISNYNKSKWAQERSSIHILYFLRSLHVSVCGCGVLCTIEITTRKLKFIIRDSNKHRPRTSLSHIRFHPLLQGYYSSDDKKWPWLLLHIRRNSKYHKKFSDTFPPSTSLIANITLSFRPCQIRFVLENINLAPRSL